MGEIRIKTSQSVEFTAPRIMIPFVAVAVEHMEIVARSLLKIVTQKQILKWSVKGNVEKGNFKASQSVMLSACPFTIQFVAVTVKLMEIVAKSLLKIVAQKPILHWPVRENVDKRFGSFGEIHSQGFDSSSNGRISLFVDTDSQRVCPKL